MAQFVNPRSAEKPPRFLATFNGECSNRGYGYLGGDPVTQSYYHVKWFNKPCFAPGGLADNICGLDFCKVSVEIWLTSNMRQKQLFWQVLAAAAQHVVTAISEATQ
jgi:hypothetical protein